MAEIGISEEEFGEPVLNYWKPVAKPAPMVLPSFPQNFVTNGYGGWPCPVPSYNQTAIPPSYVYHQTAYPLNEFIHSYIQNQPIGLSAGPFEVEQRQLSHCSPIGADHVLYTLSATPNYAQDSQAMTDNMIQDEVTRAAKTLFSKRNRTLLHWLNPDVNKNQIKIDVNAAWESLPAAEKMFYISQVLGKFSPHVTSLMVNPQLEPSSKVESSRVKSPSIDRKSDKTVEIKNSTGTKARRKPKSSLAKSKPEINPAIKEEVKTEDDGSFESDVVKAEKSKEIVSTEEKPRVKRKYTKRKRKDGNLDPNAQGSSTNSSPLPVDINNIKVEPETELPIDVKNIKLEPETEFPVDVKVEPGVALPVDIKNIKKEPGTDSSVGTKDNKVKASTSAQGVPPQPKRKYVKRKLVRKKYKRREPKQKPPISFTELPEIPESGVKIEGGLKIESELKGPESEQNDEKEMELNLWIELGNDSILTNEEVDRFFDSIEDPDSLFRELGIIENIA